MVESVVQSHAEIVVGSDEKKPIRVLHVDDELGLLKVAKQCLELQGPFQVDTAGSVEEALNKLKEQEYDAVVSDYQMPGKDGLEFLEMLRKNGNTIPFIMFTGKGREEVAVRAWSLGADHYVNKAGDPETVYCELAHCLRSTVEKHFAEAQMKETVQKLQTIYQNAIEGITYVDAEENIVFANKAFADIVGYEQEQLAGMSLRRIVDDENWAKIESETKRRRQGESSRYEAEFRRRDGTVRNAQVSGAPLLDHDGRFAGTIGIVLDITEGKKAEDQIKKSAEEWSRTFDAITDLVLIIDKRFRLVRVNKSVCDALKKKPEELIGKHCYEVMHGTDKPWPNCPHKKTLETKAATSSEISDPHLGMSLLVTDAPIFDENGELVQCVHTVKNMSLRIKMEEALRESEAKYRSLVEQSTQGIVVAQGSIPHIVFANSAMSKILGYTVEELTSLSPQQTIGLVHPDDRELFFGRFKDRLEGKAAPPQYEVRGIRKDGTVVWMELSSARIEYDGQPAVQAIFADITERKKTEEALRASEEKHRVISGITADFLFSCLKKGEGSFAIDWMSGATEKVFGYSAQEIEDKGCWSFLVHPQDLPTFEEKVTGLRPGQSGVCELRITHKDGSTRWIKTSSQVVKDSINPTNLRLFGACEDVTERKKTEELLRESEERFRGLFESIQDPVGIFVGREGRLIEYNAAFKKSSGYTDEELKGKAFLDFVHPDDHALVLEKYQTEYSEEEFPLVYEIRGMNKNGESLPLEISVSPYEKEGRVIGIEVIHRDITERKRYERSLSALNAYGGDLNMAESMEEIYRLTLDAMQKVLGFEYADFFIIDKSVLCIVDQRGYPEPFPLELPLDGNKKGITTKVAKTGNSVIVRDVRENTDFVEGLPGILSELAVPIKVGQKTLGVLNVESRKLNAFDEKDQELLEILASHAVTAISNLDRARELEAYAREIRESQQKFEGLFRHNPEAAVYLDVNFKIADVNPRFCQLFGYSAEKIKGRNINDVVAPEDLKEEAESLDKDAKNGYASHSTVRKRKDGSLVPVSISAAPVTFENNLLGYVEIYKDITELKRAQEESEESNTRFKNISDIAGDWIWEIDIDGRYTYSNASVEHVLGYVPEEVLGKHFYDFYPADEQDKLKNVDMKIFARKERFTSFVHKDGHMVIVETRAVPIVTSDGKILGYRGSDRDVTETWQAQKALKESEERTREAKKHFQMLFDLMADPVAVVDGKGRILEVTRKIEEITGFKREELVGKNVMKVDMFGAMTKAKMIKGLAKRMMGMNVEPYEVEVLKKDGGKLLYEINAARIDYKGTPADLVVFRDILERKNMEEKLRVVGSLTRHDVRNKLSAVTGNAYLLKRRLAGNPETLEQLADMENAVRNVEAIFEFARTYEKLGAEQLAYVDVKKAVDEAVGLFPDLKGVRIANECGGLAVLADSLLRQLFYNLIEDSLKYGEKLTQIRIHYEKSENQLKLVYEDDGVGISKDNKAKLFSEGFNTGKGSGYGLYLIKRMMDVYRWTIEETGTPGKGARFTMVMPEKNQNGKENYQLH